MRVLIIIWFCLLSAVLVITLIFKGEATQFYGIAETREIVINAENSVEIKRIHVVLGQIINEADTLAELHRPELTMKINEITHQLDELKAQKKSLRGICAVLTAEGYKPRTKVWHHQLIQGVLARANRQA